MNVPSVLVAWGSNSSSQLGAQDARRSPSIVQLPFSSPPAAVACGAEHCAVVLRSGRLVLFGRNKEGQCGAGEENRDVVAPICLPPFSRPVTLVACGSSHTIALAGQVYEWGLLLAQSRGDENREGYQRYGKSMMGAEDSNEFRERLVRQSFEKYLLSSECHEEGREIVQTPRAAMGLPNKEVKGLATGWAHAAVLMEDGRVWAAGYNEKGQLGIGTRVNNGCFVECHSPKDVKFQKVAAGLNHLAACATDGSVYTWGLGSLGQLGLGKKKEARTPTRVQSLVEMDFQVVDVVAGDNHTLAQNRDGEVCGWGHTEYFQLGTRVGERQGTDNPIRIRVNGVRSISAGGKFSLVALDDGIHTWGWNSNRELGQGAFQYGVHPMPVQLTTLPAQTHLDFVSISCGANYAACVVQPKDMDAQHAAWGPRNPRLAAHQNMQPDFVLKTVDGAVRCHRRVLKVRCPKLIEDESITQSWPTSSVQKIVDYLYSDREPLNKTVDQQLVQLAVTLGLGRFKAILEDRSTARAAAEGEGQYVRVNGKWVQQDTLEQPVNTGGIPESTFYEDMAMLQQGGDLVLRLKGPDGVLNVTAWRSLLCDAHYFAALLDRGFLEANQSEVIVQVDDAAAAAAAITFMHTGDRRRVSYGNVDPSALWKVADLFGMDDVVELGEEWTATM